jgi:hypothetical protein
MVGVMDIITRDDEGRLWAGDYPLPFKVDQDGTLLFYDRDKRRSARRGREIIEVRAADLIAALREVQRGTADNTPG